MGTWKTDHSRMPDRGNRVTVIGITGGVGAGKSRILQILEEEYHARILLADEVAAQQEEPGEEGLLRLVECFGRQILQRDGRLDRKAFADRIFQDPEALGKVNRIIHPLTWRALCQRVEELSSLAGEEELLIAVEAALFNEESRQLCDVLWYVDTPKESRIMRLMENRGYTREKCENIIHSQPCREDFLALADEVIDNSGAIEEVRQQIARLLSQKSWKYKKENHEYQLRNEDPE